MLLVTPAVALVHFFHFRDLRRSILFSLSALPALAFFLTFKVLSRSFVSPMQPSLALSGAYLEAAFHPIEQVPGLRIFAALGLAGMGIAISQTERIEPGVRDFLKRCLPGVVLAGLILIFITPFFLPYRQTERASLAWCLMLSVYAALSVEYATKVPHGAAAIFSAGMCALSIWSAYVHQLPGPSTSYVFAQNVLETLARIGGGAGKAFTVCDIEPRFVIRPEDHFIGDTTAALRLYGRVSGWDVTVRKCTDPPVETPRIWIFAEGTLRPEFFEQLSPRCSFTWKSTPINTDHDSAIVCFEKGLGRATLPQLL